MEQLKTEIKQLIISTLDLDDISVEDIADDEPLFVEGLGLDSIDALELGLALKKHFNVQIESTSDEVKKYFRSVNSLAEFVQQQSQ